MIAAIYHCNKTLLAYAKSCRGGAWGAMAAKHLIHRIAGSKLLIIGLGRIGGAVAAKGKGNAHGGALLRPLCFGRSRRRQWV
ncbi:MAG: NAD(P)-dependent oxidoreductase [Ruminococcus sp.]